MDLQLNPQRLPAPNNINVLSRQTAWVYAVTWDPVPNPNPATIASVGYNVYQASSANGVYYLLNSAPLSDNHLDVQQGRNPNVNYFYKVSALAATPTGAWLEGPLSSSVVFNVVNSNVWFDKMNERNRWILKNTGVLMDLYVRRNGGAHCSCYNEEYGQGTGDCPLCYGTGYTGGYDPAYQLWFREAGTQEQLEVQRQGLVINKQPAGWTISKTLLKNRDVLINQRGIMYQVLNSNINNAAGFYFHQNLMLKEFDPTDVIYSLQRASLYPEF